MHRKAAAIGVSVLLCACAQAPPPAQPPPSGAPVVAATPPPPVPRGEHVIILRTVHCADLLNAAEDDRAAGSMVLLGYEAARLGIRSIDVGDVEGIERAALAFCAEHPDRPAADAFARGFREIKP
jgi:hypothetical protein